MRNIFLGFLVALALVAPVYSQTKDESAPPSAPIADVFASAAKVDGLELPPDQTVSNDEGFITIQAKTKGTVKWLVVSAVKVRYVSVPENSLIVSVPANGGVITVFAVAVVDGKLTEFARTSITVNGTAPPGPKTAPAPITQPGPGALHVTLLVDVNSMTADVAAILNSKQLQSSVTAKGNFFRFYDMKNPIVAQRKLDVLVQKIGSPFVIIVQRSNGVVVLQQAMPRTEQEVSVLLKKVGGM